MKSKTLGIAVAVAIGTLSTAAFAVTPIGNNSQKGSLLIYSRIDVRAGGDTLITLTNDSASAVRVKCYYASSDPLAQPYTGTALGAKTLKHFRDFTIDLTHNQPVSWWASTGSAVGPSARVTTVAPPFGIFPADGAVRDAGELKCWAIGGDAVGAEISYNHLFGTASIISTTGQAYEYTASAFQNLSATGTQSGTPGILNLDNAEYDACPNILLGNFIPGNRGDGGMGPRARALRRHW